MISRIFCDEKVSISSRSWCLYIFWIQKSQKWSFDAKGETITRVHGNVSFFAGKRIQNS